MASRRGERVPRPIKRWAQAGLSDRLLTVIEKQGYAAPRPPSPPPPHPPPPPPVQVRGAVPDPGAGAAVHHERARRHRGREDRQRQDDGVRSYAPPRAPRTAPPPRRPPPTPRLPPSPQVRAADASSRDGPASAPGRRRPDRARDGADARARDAGVPRDPSVLEGGGRERRRRTEAPTSSSRSLS